MHSTQGSGWNDGRCPALAFLWLVLLVAPVYAEEPQSAPPAQLADPLARFESGADELAKELFAAFLRYDAAALVAGEARLAARMGGAEEVAGDAYLHAQGSVLILVMRRYYEVEDPEGMPAALAGIDPVALAGAGLARAAAFAASHPDHSDIERVQAELLSFQIRDMMSGMTKGPAARAAVGRALAKDPTNGWALFAQARMHFHNPAFAGGDKDLALQEFRRCAEVLGGFRAKLYLARAYHAKEMDTQARFWARKALAAAPDNPEVKRFAAALEPAAAPEGAGR